MKKYIFTALLVAQMIPTIVFGLDFEIKSGANIYKPQTPFFVDIMVDPDGVNVNGVDGVVTVTGDATILRIENGGSIIKNWIVPPKAVLNGNTANIEFSGIIPNGFAGYANSFTGDNLGLVMRIVLNGNNGKIDVDLKNAVVTKNDGNGTLVNTANKKFTIQINDNGFSQPYKLSDIEKPELSYEIVKDTNLLNGKKVLVFSAIDSKSGVAAVYVKEGNGQYVLANSPYLLEDQLLRGIISIKVVDNAGNVTELSVHPSAISYLSKPGGYIPFIALLVLVWLNIYLKHATKKRKSKKTN